MQYMKPYFLPFRGPPEAGCWDHIHVTFEDLQGLRLLPSFWETSISAAGNILPNVAMNNFSLVSINKLLERERKKKSQCWESCSVTKQPTLKLILTEPLIHFKTKILLSNRCPSSQSSLMVCVHCLWSCHWLPLTGLALSSSHKYLRYFSMSTRFYLSLLWAE